MKGFYNGNISTATKESASITQMSIAIAASTALINIVEESGVTAYSLVIVDSYGNNETGKRFPEYGENLELIVCKNLSEACGLIDKIGSSARVSYSM